MQVETIRIKKFDLTKLLKLHKINQWDTISYKIL